MTHRPSLPSDVIDEARPVLEARRGGVHLYAWMVWSDDTTLCHPMRDVVRTREHARAIAANGIGLRVIRVRVVEV